MILNFNFNLNLKQKLTHVPHHRIAIRYDSPPKTCDNTPAASHYKIKTNIV